MSLALQMAIATLLGVLSGLFFGELCQIFAPWGNAYIMLLKVTTIPYLFVAIIQGIGQLSSGQAKQILKKGVFFIGLAWAINITMIYLTVFLFPASKGLGTNSYISNEPTSINFAELLIPENIFYALSNNIVPAVVIFSLLLGIAMMHLREKQAMMQVLETTVEALTRITKWISRITPLGTFIIIAYQVGTVQFQTIKQVSTYIILYIFVICILVFWIFPKLASMLTTITTLRWIKDLIPILLLAYTTSVVIVCLPYIIQMLQKETQALYPLDEKAQSQTQGIVSIVFNLPLASLFITVFIFFIAAFFNTPIGIKGQAQLFLTTFLTGLGAVGIGSWINSLTFLLDTLTLPLESINLYLVTLPFTSGFQSMLSVMEISTLSLLILLACRHLLSFQWHKIARNVLYTAAPVILIFTGIKLFNPLPKIQNLQKSICDLSINCDVSMQVFFQNSLPPQTSNAQDPFERIVKTKILRVGYNPHVTPFCFENSHGGIVGYDIAFACELAKDLGCQLQLIPMQYGRLAEELDQGLYDIGMSAVSITEERLKQVCFASPYIDSKIVFVTLDNRRKEFSSLETMYSKADIKIAVLKGSSFEELAHRLFSPEQLVLLDSYQNFTGSDIADAILWEEQEAISWVIAHPHYHVVFPTPSLGIDSLGYPVKAGSDRLLNYLNQWLKLKANEGFSEKQYNLWILGKTAPSSTEEPRWSILRDILHWQK